MVISWEASQYTTRVNVSQSSALSVADHRRDSSGMQYVYPVISRRAGGVSVGINLNPNSACNWQCIYCQVPGLTRGGPPAIDIALLERELRQMLGAIVHGNFMAERVPVEARRFSDIAFSGNGEPTSAREFRRCMEIAVRLREEFGLGGQVVLRLITNGSLLDRTEVQAGVALLGKADGEVWFKLDRGSAAGMQLVNGSRQNPATVVRRLRICGSLCRTWVQSCFFAIDGSAPNEKEIDAYLELLAEARPGIAGVHLYGLARQSYQPQASRLASLAVEWLDDLAGRIERIGLTVRVSP